MIAMHRFLVLLLLAFLISRSRQQGKSVNDLIKDLFKNPNETTVEPGGCVCVPYYLCTSSDVLNTNGEGLIDIRIDEDKADERVCDSYMEVCCNFPDVTKDPIKPDETNKTKRYGCGWRNPKGVGGFRITGNENSEAEFAEFPWMVAILDEETIEGLSGVLNRYQCGGSLIHPQAVITAAHCVSDKTKKYKIRAGEWDTQTSNEIFPHEDRYVKSVTIHPNYSGNVLLNDMAFLLLESPLTRAYENVNTVCLPHQGTVMQGGERCFATGWGKDKFSKEGRYQVILKKVELPFVDRNTCQTNLRTTRLGRYFQLHNSFVCAGGEKGKDVCQGDGGSPLVCPIPGEEERYQQIGIVAWGIGCGDSDVPGVYVNVALFTDWINQQAAYNNLTIKSYEN